jgi:UDP-glucose 4-epimerase
LPIQYAERSQATFVKNRIGSTKKANEQIGFTANIDLREGLKRLIEWRATHKSEVSARRKALGLAA